MSVILFDTEFNKPPFRIEVTVYAQDEETARAAFKKYASEALSESRKYSFCGGGGGADDPAYSVIYGVRPLTERERIQALEKEIAALKATG